MMIDDDDDDDEEEEESICAWTDVGAFVFKGQSEFWATLMLMLMIASKIQIRIKAGFGLQMMIVVLVMMSLSVTSPGHGQGTLCIFLHNVNHFCAVKDLNLEFANFYIVPSIENDNNLHPHIVHLS